MQRDYCGGFEVECYVLFKTFFEFLCERVQSFFLSSRCLFCHLFLAWRFLLAFLEPREISGGVVDWVWRGLVPSCLMKVLLYAAAVLVNKRQI